MVSRLGCSHDSIKTILFCRRYFAMKVSFRLHAENYSVLSINISYLLGVKKGCNMPRLVFFVSYGSLAVLHTPHSW